MVCWRLWSQGFVGWIGGGGRGPRRCRPTTVESLLGAGAAGRVVLGRRGSPSRAGRRPYHRDRRVGEVEFFAGAAADVFLGHFGGTELVLPRHGAWSVGRGAGVRFLGEPEFEFLFAECGFEFLNRGHPFADGLAAM